MNAQPRIERVLVAVDFGDASRAAVAMGGALARTLGARLQVLHAEAIEVPPYFTESQIAAIEAERTATRDAAEQFVSRFAAQHTSVRFEARVVEGPPAERILDAARDADLIVIGTHGRRGPRRWWMGSVAEAVVRRATIPVLVTHALARDAANPFESAAPVVIATGGSSSDEVGWLELLRRHFGARVTAVADLAACSPSIIQGAQIVVIRGGAGSDSSDVVTHVLRSCLHPVRFIPIADSSRSQS